MIQNRWKVRSLSLFCLAMVSAATEQPSSTRRATSAIQKTCLPDGKRGRLWPDECTTSITTRRPLSGSGRLARGKHWKETAAHVRTWEILNLWLVAFCVTVTQTDSACRLIRTTKKQTETPRIVPLLQLVIIFLEVLVSPFMRGAERTGPHCLRAPPFHISVLISSSGRRQIAQVVSQSILDQL